MLIKNKIPTKYVHKIYRILVTMLLFRSWYCVNYLENNISETVTYLREI